MENRCGGTVHESLGLHARNEVEERIEERESTISDIEEDGGLCDQTELIPRQNFEELVEGSEATGKNDEPC